MSSPRRFLDNMDDNFNVDEFRNTVSDMIEMRPSIGGAAWQTGNCGCGGSPFMTGNVGGANVLPEPEPERRSTRTKEETDRILSDLSSELHMVGNPQIIRQPTADGLVTVEQRILLRCLEPPPLPPQEPDTIIHVRPPQPPAPRPLVIVEKPPPLPEEPPIILRERPPVPPPRRPPQKETRTLPAVPVPKRSVIIKRFPPAAEKPRDIIIERWLPYQDQPTPPPIVTAPPPPVVYPDPYFKIFLYDAAERRIVRKMERLCVTRADPESYTAQHGPTLLDSATLLQKARELGVVEDLTCQGNCKPVCEVPKSNGCDCGCNGYSGSGYRTSYATETYTSARPTCCCNCAGYANVPRS